METDVKYEGLSTPAKTMVRLTIVGLIAWAGWLLVPQAQAWWTAREASKLSHRVIIETVYMPKCEFREEAVVDLDTGVWTCEHALLTGSCRAGDLKVLENEVWTCDRLLGWNK